MKFEHLYCVKKKSEKKGNWYYKKKKKTNLSNQFLDALELSIF